MTTSRVAANDSAPKYRQILDQLAREIRDGKYQAGQKLPSEASLVRQFGASRITVGRALRELTQQGLVGRRAGSGTFVKQTQGAGQTAKLFGLLIPNLGESEIFEPICQGMANAPEAAEHGLIWGHSTTDEASRDQQARQLCRQFVDRKVAGVFFAPVEQTPGMHETNREILTLLEQASIPVVLLDRDALPFPQRSRHDLVGIDNRRAGYLATEHLLAAGCRRVMFVTFPGAAATVAARIAGYREALRAYDLPPDSERIQRFASFTRETVKAAMEEAQADGIVCINDRAAGQLMRELLSLGYRVPQDMCLAGIDDVEYASLLPVPLTTIHQPCREIGEAAMAVMLERIEHPGRLTRDVLLECSLVVRESSGGERRQAASTWKSATPGS